MRLDGDNAALLISLDFDDRWLRVACGGVAISNQYQA